MMKHRGTAFVAVLAAVMMATAAIAFAAVAAVAERPDLGTSNGFAVLAATSVNGTGTVAVNGDLGISPGTTITGTDTITVSGDQYLGEDPVAMQAQADALAAFEAAIAATATPIAEALNGVTLTPGSYESSSGDFQLNVGGTENAVLTFDAQDNPDAVFILKAQGRTDAPTSLGFLMTQVGSQMELVNGANADNIFWFVNDLSSIGSGSTFKGHLVSMYGITAPTGGAQVEGQLISLQGSVSMEDGTTVTLPAAIDTTPPGDPGEDTTPTPALPRTGLTPAAGGPSSPSDGGWLVITGILAAVVAGFAGWRARAASRRG